LKPSFQGADVKDKKAAMGVILASCFLYQRAQRTKWLTNLEPLIFGAVMTMRLKFITCKVLQKEAYWCASQSVNIVDVVLMPQGLHNTPDQLRRRVQSELNQTTDAAGRPYDAMLLGYGLCSNGVSGLTAAIRTVIPRGHDCITLLLGSKDRYQTYFDTHRGVYWYSSGWIETGTLPGPDRHKQLLAEYTSKYGPDNARFLMQVEQEWIKQYHWAAYIDWHLPDSEQQKAYTRRCAEFLGWQFDVIEGDRGLMQRLVDARWDEREFLIVPPGQTIIDDLTSPCLIRACKL
jgi:hypothetical protein